MYLFHALCTTLQKCDCIVHFNQEITDMVTLVTVARSDNADFRTLLCIILVSAACPASTSEKSESLVFSQTG